MSSQLTENPAAHPRKPRRSAQRTLWIAAIILGILHQDFWLWDHKGLLLGFLPIGLGYHVLFSICVSLLWIAAVVWAWPTEVEESVKP
jgi:hypothetical protein